MTLEAFLDLLDKVRSDGNTWTALCPAHDDHEPSLSVTEGDDDRILVYCHAGCSVEEIVGALGVNLSDLFDANGDQGDSPGLDRQAVSSARRATLQPREETPSDEERSRLSFVAPPTQQRATTGLTLQEDGAAKQLPLESLSRWGLRDTRYRDQAAIAVPYFDENGTEVALRYRLALEGPDRFRWKQGARRSLYGLAYLQRAREAGYVVVVEGESDCHTLWAHDIPALGIPGANTWQEPWAEFLSGIPIAYVVIELDAGGRAVLRWLEASSLRDRVRLVRFDRAKDVSALYLSDPGQFLGRFAAALGAATPWAEWSQAQADTQRQEAWTRCEALAREPHILDRFAEALGTLVAGESRAGKLLYLILTTRFLERPVSAAIKGPSSGGKSHLVASALQFFPENAHYGLTAMSERALAYSNEPLRHRFLVLFEAAGLQGDFASYLVRSLLSEGRLRYETVEKTEDGMRPRVIEREGPTGLLVTTTAVRLHEENETRLFSISVTDTADQTRAVFRRLAQGDESPTIDFASWHALQVWLEGSEHRVAIPFAMNLAELIPPVSVRLRRDFKAVLSLIQAHAILQQANRERTATGKIVASLDDYEAVRALIADLVSEGAEVAVPSTIRETVQAVRELLQDGRTGQPRASLGDRVVTAATVAQRLGIDKSAALRRLKVAADRGYLRNEEDRRGRPGRWVVGEPLPEEHGILPSADTVALSMAGGSAGEDNRHLPETNSRNSSECTGDRPTERICSAIFPPSGEPTAGDSSAPASDNGRLDWLVPNMEQRVESWADRLADLFAGTPV